EMNDMVVQCVADENQVANVLRVCWNLELKGVFNGAHRGHGMDRGANSTEALRKHPAFTGVAPLQNRLNAAPHGAACPCLLHATAIDLDIDAQVTFNASYWVDSDSGHGVSPFDWAAWRRCRTSLNM